MYSIIFHFKGDTGEDGEFGDKGFQGQTGLRGAPGARGNIIQRRILIHHFCLILQIKMSTLIFVKVLRENLAMMDHKEEEAWTESKVHKFLFRKHFVK